MSPTQNGLSQNNSVCHMSPNEQRSIVQRDVVLSEEMRSVLL